MSLFTSLSMRRLAADARIFLYPEVRKEWFASVSAGATLRQLTVRGFAPLVRVTYERNNSSLTLYDYRRLSTNLGITRAF
jgi:outer membrane protein